MGKLTLKPGIKKAIKRIFITLGVLFIAFIVLCVYLVVQDLKQEEVLKQEIINYSNKNLATDSFDITVKTTGDYAYVEEAIKKYYKKLSDSIKTVNTYLNSDKINTMFSVDNLASDRPDYSLSHNSIKTARVNINQGISDIKDLCDEETIKNLLDQKKLDDPEYYYDFYLQLMYTDQDKEEFENLKKSMDTLSQNLNAFLDKFDEILNFLETNDANVEYKDGVIYFKTEELLKEYKTHLTQLDDLATKITVTESDVENDTDAV